MHFSYLSYNKKHLCYFGWHRFATPSYYKTVKTPHFGEIMESALEKITLYRVGHIYLSMYCFKCYL